MLVSCYSGGGKREFGGGWLPNRPSNFLKTLTVKNPPTRVRARESQQQGWCVLCKIMHAMHHSQIGAGLPAVK